MAKSNMFMKLSKCEVCIAAEAKYTCPKCEVRTCSLPCVRIHKKELECDGIRDKVAFKPMSKMTNLDLLSDYRLLEEAKRSVDSYQRDVTKRYSRRYKELPIQLFRLGAAAQRRGTHIKFLPQHFTRHKTNTTYLDWKTQVIHWRVEWIFPQADNLELVNDKVFEGDRLALPLDQFLDPSATSEKSVRDRLQWYQSAGLPGVVLLLKAENILKAGLRYFQLDPSLTLQANLSGKSIVEFPVIYVVLKPHLDLYDIMTPEEEEEIEAAILSASQPPSWKNKRPHPSQDQGRNLLFSEDSTDIEEAKRSKQESCREADDTV